MSSEANLTTIPFDKNSPVKKKAIDAAKSALLQRLLEILAHEKQHFEFYQHSMFMLKGMERLYLLPLLEKEMMGELSHVRLFADKIVAMGGLPAVKAKDFPTDKMTAHSILAHAIKLEKEVIQLYHDVYPEAEFYAKIADDMSIVLMLEEQIEHSTADMEEMEKMLNVFSHDTMSAVLMLEEQSSDNHVSDR